MLSRVCFVRSRCYQGQMTQWCSNYLYCKTRGNERLLGHRFFAHRPNTALIHPINPEGWYTKEDMQRYKCYVEYDGSAFSGWASNGGLPENETNTVQGLLQSICEKFWAKNPSLPRGSAVYGSGRTDSGVHAIAQCFHVDLPKELDISGSQFRRALNYHITKQNRGNDVRISQVSRVPKTFHARHTALERQYVYRILDTNTEFGTPVFLQHRVWTRRAKAQQPALDVAKMQAAADELCGMHNNQSFRGARCYRDSPVSFVRFIEVTREPASFYTPSSQNGETFSNLIHVRLHAPCFLYRQVRIMVGTLVEIGAGEDDPVQRIRGIRQRENRGLNTCPTAPATGLYFERTLYEDHKEWD